MNYDNIRAQAESGISFFMDDDESNSSYRILFSKGGVTVDPKTGKEIKTPLVEGLVFGAIRDVNDRDINGETILAGDKRGIFKAPYLPGGVEAKIEKGMIVTIDGDDYRVVNPRGIKPGGSTVVAYRPILRRVAVPNG